MSDTLQIAAGEFQPTRVTGPLVGLKQSMDVWLWDLGPEEPEQPDAPEPPSGKDGEPKYELAKLHYKRAVAAYEEALSAYDQARREFNDWRRRSGGPMEQLFWSTNARDALVNDMRAFIEKRQKRLRWRVSERSARSAVARDLIAFVNGALRKENVTDAKGNVIQIGAGLPRGMKPGHGHQANVERQIAGEKEFVEALRQDPQFGQEMQP